LVKQINPISDIVRLNVGGCKDFDVKKSTLCLIKGSALEKMFSDRHKLDI